MNIAKTILFYAKLAAFLSRGNVVASAQISEDYDRLSGLYDDNFSFFVGRHSRDMVARMSIREGMTVCDLACGTGTISLALAEAVGGRGRVLAFDQSEGMLSVARRKARTIGLRNIEFVCLDMESGIGRLKNESLDIVTCGWAIGYVPPNKLLKTAAHKIKPGGLVGVIENTRDTLDPVRKTALKVAMNYPEHFVQAMDLHMRLPKDIKHLRRLFRSSGLTPAESWQGESVFNFGSGSEVLTWVLHTGASAGFDRVMSPGSKDICDEAFVRIIEKDFSHNGVITVAHKFVAGIARKGK
jgi:ubiquinone/menaquinone biosynthesis C-methylase UbiE